MHLDSQQLNEYQPEETDAQTEEAEDDEVSTAQDTAENVSEMYYGYYGLDETKRKLYMEILQALTQLREDVKVSTLNPD